MAKLFLIKLKLFLKLTLIILSVTLGYLFFYLYLKLPEFTFFIIQTQAAANSSADAIAMRIIPNPDHYSAERWYKEQQFKGSPQSLLVDGYEAVRDGRTVYVNAANISNNNFYTNIYITSYNQQAETATLDIFGQILSHWKFNTNITLSDFCSKTTTKACLNDYDCPSPEYCLSQKAQIVKDTRRLADLAEIKIALDSYKNDPSHNYYPKLNSGTYLPNKTISVWPSWQQTLAKELKVILPIDPINKLGQCLGDYDPITCWDEKNKRFADPTPNDNNFDLPDSSYVYIYLTNANGLEYSVCANTESGIDGVDYKTCLSSVANNHAPVINCGLVQGDPHSELTGTIEAQDEDRNVLSWSPMTFVRVEAYDNNNILQTYTDSATINSNWTNLGWVVSNIPVFRNTHVSDNKVQKEVYSLQTGNKGIYTFNIEVSDSMGGTDTKDCKIYLGKTLEINASDQEVVIGKNLDFTITGSDADPGNISYMFSPKSPIEINSCSTSNNCRVYLQKIEVDTKSYSYQVIARNNMTPPETVSEDFTINVINHPPTINALSGMTVYVDENKSVQVAASDLDGHSISYELLAPTPSQLSISNSGLISGFKNLAINLTPYTVTVRVRDQYYSKTIAPSSAEKTISFKVTVNSRCGDGIVDSGSSEQCDDGNTNDTDTCNNSCQWTCRGINNIMFNTGVGDSIYYDDDNDPNTSNNVPGGRYLKLTTSMATPYIWIANSNLNSITKLRTYDGCQKTSTGWNCSIWESRGQLIGSYDVSTDPSRTAINVETGDVWVANRGSGNVTKLNINGVVQKTCLTGGGPRGVAIEENGDVWIANFADGTLVKISGDNTNCAILATVNVGGGPYGLAIDSNNNVWVSNRGTGMIQKIDTISFVRSDYGIPAVSCGDAGNIPYGITVDLNGNIWVADTCIGVYKLTQATGIIDHYYFSGLAHSYGRSRGVTIDMNGSIWIVMDYSAQVVKVSSTNPANYQIFNTTGMFPIGIVGDSAGQVWAINYNSNTATVFDLSGTIVDTIPVNSLPPPFSYPYTYSDMTGLNRAMLLRAGNWLSNPSGIFDSGYTNQHWGKISWQQIVPSVRQSVDVYVWAGNTIPPSIAWISAAAWNSQTLLQRQGRFFKIKVEMRSRQRSITPVLWDLSLGCN